MVNNLVFLYLCCIECLHLVIYSMLWGQSVNNGYLWYEIGLIGFKKKQKYFGVNEVESCTYGS